MKSDERKSNPIIEKKFYLHDQKKNITFKTPDISKMQEVIIDARTKMYIAVGADPEEARLRYVNRLQTKDKVQHASRKPVATPAA
jgi:hypothetical protein